MAQSIASSAGLKRAIKVNVTILGAGAFGTALARVIALNQHAVTLWGHKAEQLREIQAAGENARHLPGIKLPCDLKFQADLSAACEGANVIVLALPSRAFREVGSQLGNCSAILVSVTKGIEFDSGLTMTGVLEEVCPSAKVAGLSGPSLAMEVARDIPTAVVASATSTEVAETVQQIFHRPSFRVYTGKDLLGIELGGALKNVIAIAAGICDGLGFGDNAKAALITRGIVEMRRIGVACGAQPDTFSGLSGLGDLTVTCFSKLSRNRALGERIGSGEKISEILASLTSVTEGVPTARSAHQLAQAKGIDDPIIREVYSILHEAKNPKHALYDLLSRGSKAE
ncbi:MAG TPA: NAD(P)H-dependent glycerol-3-phosphate dehydrogenase [Methylomirabilota bacterium]|nr:NAD(P)H-dependent glycerol-3-phosphate dehydrogenase [Methylomirabilota bacterium]